MIGVPTFYNLAFVPTDNVGEPGRRGAGAARARSTARPQAYMARIRDELRDEVSRTCRPTSCRPTSSPRCSTSACRRRSTCRSRARDPRRDLRDRARRCAAQIRKVPGTEDVRIAQVFDHPALRLDVDRQQAAQLEPRLARRRDQPAHVAQLVAAAPARTSGSTRKNGVNYIVAVQTPIVADGQRRRPAGHGGRRPRAASRRRARPPTRQPTPSPLDAGTSTLASAGHDAPYLGGIARLVPTQDRASISHYTVQPIVDVQASVARPRSRRRRPATSRTIVDAVEAAAAHAHHAPRPGAEHARRRSPASASG